MPDAPLSYTSADFAWLEHWTDARLIERFGARCVQRARRYADGGNVMRVRAESTARIKAKVWGTDRDPYDCTVSVRWLGRDGQVTLTWLSSTCSCPVGIDCKHGVAAVMRARAERIGEDQAKAERGARVPDLPAWEQALTGIVTDAVAKTNARAELQEVALRFSKQARAAGRFGAYAPSKSPEFTIRPMVRGASGRWIKTGIDWERLDAVRTTLEPDQFDALLAIRRLQVSNRYSYQTVPDELPLTNLGPRVWERLAAAEASGIALIGEKLPRPRIVEEPASVDLVAELADAAEADNTDHADGPDNVDNGALNLQVRVRHEGLGIDAYLAGGEPSPTAASRAMQLGGADRLWLVGSSPTGMALWTRDALVFAPLAKPLEAAFRRLVDGQLPVRVPGPDVERFVSTFLPPLRRSVPVEAGPGVELPVAERPRLRVVAAFGADHRVKVTTAFMYGDTVAQGGGGGPLRDPAGEQLVIDSLPRPPEAPEGLTVLVRGRRALAPAQVFSGLDTIVVATRLLPALARNPDVVVVVEGDPPEYREQASEPVIEFRMDDHLGAHEDDNGTTAAAASDRLARTDWFDLGITVRVEDQVVTFVDLFKALARGEAHLVLPNGAWFALDRPEFDQLRELIEEAKHLIDPERSVLTVTPMDIGLWEHLVALGVVAEESSQWRRRVEALLGTGDEPPPAPPASLQATLRPYQADGFAWMVRLWRAGLGGILADDMGLGKTLQVLALATHLRESGQLDEAPLLVVAPTSVLETWVREARRFAPDLVVATVEATRRKSGRPIEEVVAGAHLVVTTYAVARIDAEEFARARFAGLVLDEAQFVKNHRSKTYYAVRAIKAPVRFAVTGTPLENSLMDLWAMLSLTSPGLLPDPATFTDVYKRPIEEGTDPAKGERLIRRIRPMLLRRTKEQVAQELPPKQEQVVRVELSPAHRRVYDVRLARERARVLNLAADMGRNRVAIFSSLTMLRQLALAPALVDEASASVRSTKIDVLIELLTEVIAGGHRALVFSQFTRYLGMVRDRLDEEGIGHVYLDGSTRNRPERIAEFRDGDAPVFLISLKAGGFGLTLTEADYVFMLDPWWNPAAEQQAIDRTHRIGQDKHVMVYRLVAADTIEDKVVALQDRKRMLAEQILGDGTGLGSALTADDLRELLQD
ncbi:MAG: DEAD/DEAH box helicase [Dermatophilus congolensis]|nr:DEAD/DEAH box helicase [Dermatophilus congolensis]